MSDYRFRKRHDMFWTVIMIAAILGGIAWLSLHFSELLGGW